MAKKEYEVRITVEEFAGDEIQSQIMKRTKSLKRAQEYAEKLTKCK